MPESGLWTENANEPASRTIIALVVLMVIGLLDNGACDRGVRTGMLALFMALGLAGLLGGPLRLAACSGTGRSWASGKGALGRLRVKADLLPGECVVRFDGPSRCDGWRKRSFEAVEPDGSRRGAVAKW